MNDWEDLYFCPVCGGRAAWRKHVYSDVTCKACGDTKKAISKIGRKISPWWMPWDVVWEYK